MVNIIKELATFIPPATDLDTLEPPLHVGDPAPDIYVEPNGRNKRGYIVAFLRHIGCPFCEKTFLELRNLALLMPKYHYIAVSHGSIEATEKWCALIGGHANVQVITDDSRHLYATWGLPLIGFRHLVDPKVISETKRLGEEEGIFPGRVTSSGSRWQGAGAFAVLYDLPAHDTDELDANQSPGTVVYAHQAKHAADVPGLKTAIKAMEVERRKRDVKTANAKQAALDSQVRKKEKKTKSFEASDAGSVPSPLHLISDPSSRASKNPPRHTHFAEYKSRSSSRSSSVSSPDRSDSDMSSPPTSVSVSPPTSAIPSPPLAKTGQPATHNPLLASANNPLLASTLHSYSSVPAVASPALSSASNSSMESIVKPRSHITPATSLFRPTSISANSDDSVTTSSSMSSTSSTSSISSKISNTSAVSSNSSVGDLSKMQPNRRKLSTSAHRGASAEFVINRLNARATKPMSDL